MVRITQSQRDALPFDLDAEVAAFALAVQAHRFTENVPAPTAHPFVEMIVRQAGGQYEVVPDDELSPGQPLAQVPLVDIFARVTDAEYDEFEAAMRELPKGVQRIVDQQGYIPAGGPLHDHVRAALVVALGEGRAAEILKPRS